MVGKQIAHKSKNSVNYGDNTTCNTLFCTVNKHQGLLNYSNLTQTGEIPVCKITWCDSARTTAGGI